MCQLLSCSYSAELVNSVETCDFHGNVMRNEWRKEYDGSAQGAAWAFVRRMLNTAGEWRCSIIISSPGGNTEPRHRTIDVDIIDGQTFRVDRKESE